MENAHLEPHRHRSGLLQPQQPITLRFLGIYQPVSEPPQSGRRRQGFLVVAVATFLFLFHLGQRDLISSHEARAAQNAQRMLDDGAFGLPTLFDGQVEVQKPPGYYWLAALAGAADGGTMTPFTTRLPAALAGVLTVLALFIYLRGDAAATITALILATAVHFTAIARTARIDLPLTAAVSVGLLSLLRGCDPSATRRLAWWSLAGLAAAVAVLLKGPIGLVLMAGAFTVITLVERRFRTPGERLVHPVKALTLVLGMALLGALPWFLWANDHSGGEFLRVFVWHHNVARFLGTAPTLASHPWWYYVPRFAVDFLPWSPAFVLLTVWGLRTGLWRRDARFRLGLVWFAVMATVLSASHFKRADYLLPAYPGAALALGVAAWDWYRSRSEERSRRVAKGSFASVVLLTLAAWPAVVLALEPRRDAEDEKRPFAEAIRREAPAPNLVLLFRVESHLLAFHLGRPLHTLVEWGELNDRLREPGPHYIVTQPVYAEEVKAILPHYRLETVATLDEFTTAPAPRSLVFLRKKD